METRNSFDVPLPPDEAWAVLMDIPRMIECVPGAELTEKVDDHTYKGKIAVKLGPIGLVFNGTAEFQEIDDTAHTALVKARGNDTKGRGGANATVRFSLTPGEGDGSAVEVVTDVALSGSVAQYGRGTGIIQGVATQLIDQFSACLRDKVEGDRETPANKGEAAGSNAGAAHAGAAAPSGETARASRAGSSASKPISVLSLLVGVLRNTLANLFARK